MQAILTTCKEKIKLKATAVHVSQQSSFNSAFVDVIANTVIVVSAAASNQWRRGEFNR